MADAMDDNVDTPDSRGHDESRGVSPGANSDSTTNNNVTKSSAVKDRSCPFCRQPFTSSSLGRHLDTYIRAKNPKPPDGIHDVAEIRKLRGNITRRHARNSSVADSSKKQTSDTQQRSLPNGTAPLQPVQPSVQPQPPIHPTYMTESSHSVFRTKADWTATGVINNLPPRSGGTPNSRDLPFPRPDFSTDRQYVEDGDEREHARATELALKEVLGSIQDAVTRAHRPPVFDFDPLTLNFPALCLRILSAPATLFSATPQAGDESWPLDLPDRASYEVLRSTLRDRVKTHYRQGRAGSTTSTGQREEPKSQDSRQGTPQELHTYTEHIDNTYLHWMQLSETRKREVWNLELMRAYAEELRQNKVLDQQLDEAYREVKQLRAQIDSINRQQPWQRSRSPDASYPSLSPALLPKNVARQLVDGNVDMREWEFDRLVAKWKHTIRPRRNWAWTNAPPPPTSAPNVHDSRSHSTSSTYGRAYAPQADGAPPPPSGQMHTLPPYTSQGPTEALPAPMPISSVDSPVALSTEKQDRNSGSDVEMRDQEPAQGRRSRRMFPKDGAG